MRPRRAARRRGDDYEALDELEIGHSDVAARLGRDALEGRRRRDGDGGRDPGRDRQRARAGAIARGARCAGEPVGTRFPPQAGALLELQAVAEVRQARARPAAWSTPAPRARCARAARACCRSASSRCAGDVRRRRRGRGRATATTRRSARASATTPPPSCGGSRGMKSGRRCASCCRGPPRRPCTGTTSCSPERPRGYPWLPWPTTARPSPTSAAPPRRAARGSPTLDSGVKDARAERDRGRARGAHRRDPRGQRARHGGRARGRASTPRCSTGCGSTRSGSRAIAAGVREIVALPDPVGEVIDGFRLPNGLDVRKVRVPLGVVAVVYEARPNVTIDAAALCLKSGNAIVLRGSSIGRALQRRARARSPPRPRPRPGCPRARSRSSPAAAARSSPSSRPRTGSST